MVFGTVNNRAGNFVTSGNTIHIRNNQILEQV
jgi:hypothetical protein